MCSRLIEDGHVEPSPVVVLYAAQTLHDAFPDGIMLIFQAAVETAVIGIERDATQVSGESLHAAQHTSLHIHLDQTGGEGHVHAVAFMVVGYSLHVEFVLQAGLHRGGKVLCMCLYGAWDDGSQCHPECGQSRKSQFVHWIKNCLSQLLSVRVRRVTAEPLGENTYTDSCGSPHWSGYSSMMLV